MSNDAVDKLKERMAKAATKDSKAEATKVPSGGGSMSGEREDPRGEEESKDRDVAAGPKSIVEKQAVAEEKIAEAKAKDTEDTREETSGDERHDLIAGKELNIPPTIIAERLRNGQNPSTGEPWTREERMAYDREQEQARQRHARAVRESEDRMRKDQAEAQIQPVTHIPVNQLTDRQKKAMQSAQDSGKGAIAQATARDQNSPEELGRREATQMTEQEKRRNEAGVTEDVEREELDRAAEEDNGDEEKDADEVQAELDKNRNRN